MGLILDTSVLIEAERKKVNFIPYKKHGEAYISVLTISELLVGVHRANTEERKIKRTAFVEHIIKSIPSLSFQEEEARLYASLVYSLWKEGVTLGSHDLMIGATAITHGYAVLTSNDADFLRIPGVKMISFKG